MNVLLFETLEGKDFKSKKKSKAFADAKSSIGELLNVLVSENSKSKEKANSFNIKTFILRSCLKIELSFTNSAWSGNHRCSEDR